MHSGSVFVVRDDFVITFYLFTAALLSVTSGQGPVTQVNAILDEKAFLPCDMSTSRVDDSATLVLWYKETEENPVYSFDNRGNAAQSGSHWNDYNGRAFFQSKYSPTGLLLSNVIISDEGVYRCRVDYEKSPTKNFRIQLNVIVPPDAPNIYDEYGDNLTEGITRAYEEGATMELKCVSEGGHPKPQLQWWRDESHLENSINTVTQSFDGPNITEASITVTRLQRSNYRSTFTCRASNNNVTKPASRKVAVNMYLPPLDVTITNGTQQMTAGQTYRILCTASGSVPPAEIRWQKNGEQIDQRNEVSFSVNELTSKNITSSILRITPKETDNNLTIKCIAINPKNKAWRLETSWTLDITYPPSVTLSLGREVKADDIKEDTDVYFNCNILSNPLPYKLIWKHNGVAIHQSVKDDIIVNDKSLVLRKVKKDSIGNYTCEAFNVEGEKESNAVELRILYKPICKPNQKLMYGAAKNDIIEVMCEVDSDPEPKSFKWSFNHSQEPIPEKRFPTTIDRRRGISILTFKPQTEMDFGFLTCTAINSVGQQSIPCHYQIIPAAPPHSPQNCTVGNVTTVSLEIFCRAGFDGGLPQKFILEVMNSTTESLILNLSSQEPYFQLNTLSPGDSVQVRVYAVNAKGRSQPFELEGATLKAEKQTGLPGTLEFTPFLGIIVCVSGFILVFVFVVVCLAKRNSSLPGKSARRPNSFCIKEKTHNSLLENCDRDEKDPDLIPFKKNTGYQVLRTDANLDDDISKSTTLPASNGSQHIIVNSHDLTSENEQQLNFIDCSERMPTASNGPKESIVFVNGEKT